MARRALELAGADQGARVAVADLLLWLRDAAGAQQVIEAAIAAEDAARPVTPLVLRLARCLLARKRPRQAAQAVQAAMERWLDAEPEPRTEVAGALAAFAAELYAVGRRADGDAVLASCAAAAPQVVPAPPRVALLRQEELAPGDRSWLEEGAASGNSVFGQHQPILGRVGWSLVSLAPLTLLLLATGSAATARTAPSGLELFLLLALLLALGLGFLAAAAAARRCHRGRLGHGLVADRTHLVRVRRDRALVLPLLLLQQVKLSARSNGLVRMRLRFCGRPFREVALFTSKAEAEAFAQGAMTRRQELVQRLAAGKPAEGPRASAFAPPSLAAGTGWPRRLGLLLGRPEWSATGILLALSVVACAVTARTGARAEADERWRRAQARDRIDEYLAAASRPADPHAGDALEAARALSRRARDRWEELASPGPGAGLVARSLDLTTLLPPRIGVRVRRTADIAGPPPGLLDPGATLYDEGLLTQALERALRAVLEDATGARDLPAVGPPASDALQVTLHLRLGVEPGAFRPPAGEVSHGLAVLRADWEVEAQAPGAAPQRLAAGRAGLPDGLAVPRAAWVDGGGRAAWAGYRAQQRALLVDAISGALMALGVPHVRARVAGLVGPLGEPVPPPGVRAREPGGAPRGP
jgi:hypothetical protein